MYILKAYDSAVALGGLRISPPFKKKKKTAVDICHGNLSSKVWDFFFLGKVLF